MPKYKIARAKEGFGFYVPVGFSQMIYSYLGENQIYEGDVAAKMTELAVRDGKDLRFTTNNITQFLNGLSAVNEKNISYLVRAIGDSKITLAFESACQAQKKQLELIEARRKSAKGKGSSHEQTPRSLRTRTKDLQIHRQSLGIERNFF